FVQHDQVRVANLLGDPGLATDKAPAHPDLAQPHVSRGLAVCDYDQDGDLDFVVVDHDERVRLFRNEMQTGNWVEIRLKKKARSPGQVGGEALGARVVAWIAGRPVRRSISGVSYLSQSSRLIHLGLGTAESVDELQIDWPDGTRQTVPGLPTNSAWLVEQNRPEPRKIPPQRTALPPAESTERVKAFWDLQREALRAMKVQSDLPRAVRLFQEALALDPDHEDTLYNLGLCLARQGRTAEALAQFAHLVKVNPMSHRGLRQWAVLRARTARSREDLLEAKRWLRRAMDLNPEETGVRQILGEVHLLLGETGPAAQRLEWVCRTNPRAVGGQFLLAYLAWRQGDEAAMQDRLAAALRGRGPAWKPAGTSAEGDLKGHESIDTTILSDYWRRWDGSVDHPEILFGPLGGFLEKVENLWGKQSGEGS
ncbi:MAG: ASPIC/UnbV domain-containing protein, partial [Acidobacteriota bacterium]